MALKKNVYPALDIDPAVNRERTLQGIRDPSFPAVYCIVLHRNPSGRLGSFFIARRGGGFQQPLSTGFGRGFHRRLGRAAGGVEIPFAQGVHVLIAGMHIHLFGLAPSGEVLGDILVDATEPAWVTY